jgi:hypothetical protein
VRALARAEAGKWCSERGLTVRMDGAIRLSYDGGHGLCLEIAIPGDARRLLALGYVLLTTGLEQEAAFPGALVWVREWDIWSASFERVGWRLVEALRRTNSPPSIRDAPAQLFEGGEFVDAQAFLLQPMVFQWDAYLVPHAGDFFVLLGHHQRAQVVARTRETLEQLFTRFEEGEWDPHEHAAP